jgi:hypothetical protein
MNRTHVGLKVFAFCGFWALTGFRLVAAPVTFEGTDPGAGPGGARPNSNAAAASFDAAAAGLGAVNLINLESAPVGYFASLGIAPGVTVTLQGNESPSAGIRNDVGSVTQGYNTTSGGAKYLNVFPIINVGTARAIFDFTQPINAFGSYLTGLGTANGNLFVLFNDGSNQSIPVVGSSSGGAKFFGFTDAGASIVQVTLELRNVTGSRDIFGVDDLRYVTIPEPTTTALAASLCVSILTLFRRRNQGTLPALNLD